MRTESSAATSHPLLSAFARTVPQSFLDVLLSKPVYWFLGVLSGLSLFVEEKRRREELAMYVLPKGLESAWVMARGKGLVFRTGEFGEVLVRVFSRTLRAIWWLIHLRFSSTQWGWEWSWCVDSISSRETRRLTLLWWRVSDYLSGNALASRGVRCLVDSALTFLVRIHRTTLNTSPASFAGSCISSSDRIDIRHLAIGNRYPELIYQYCSTYARRRQLLHRIYGMIGH